MLNPLNFFSKFIKSSNQKELERLKKSVKKINDLEEQISKLEDQTSTLKKQLKTARQKTCQNNIFLTRAREKYSKKS